MSEQGARRNAARGQVVEAAQAWIDQYEGFEGSVVTGYVLIVESIRLGQPHVHTWATGDGSMPEGEAGDGELAHGGTPDMDRGPLPAWRVRGLCAEVLSCLDGREAYIQAERLRGDE
jgi:hypothetical protein